MNSLPILSINSNNRKTGTELWTGMIGKQSFLNFSLSPPTCPSKRPITIGNVSQLLKIRIRIQCLTLTIASTQLGSFTSSIQNQFLLRQYPDFDFRVQYLISLKPAANSQCIPQNTYLCIPLLHSLYMVSVPFAHCIQMITLLVSTLLTVT